MKNDVRKLVLLVAYTGAPIALQRRGHVFPSGNTLVEVHTDYISIREALENCLTWLLGLARDHPSFVDANEQPRFPQPFPPAVQLPRPNHSTKKAPSVHRREKRGRHTPKQLEMRGKAKILEDAICDQIQADTGKPLSQILDDAGVSNQVFGKSKHFKAARAAWETLTSGREHNRSFT